MLPYAIAALALAAALSARPFVAWLRLRAKHAETQAQCIDDYYRATTEFLELTDPEKDQKLRELLVFCGHRMLKGSRLIRALVLSHMRDDQAFDDDTNYFDSVSDEAVHAFSRALAAALFASSYQSAFFGRILRRALFYMVDGPNREFKTPKKVILVFKNRMARDRDGRLTQMPA